jgi:hypothetical protein
VQRSANLGIPGYNVQVYAMDSAALHARSLFEFFAKPSNRDHVGVDLYRLQPISSPKYGDRRSNPAPGVGALRGTPTLYTHGIAQYHNNLRASMAPA